LKTIRGSSATASHGRRTSGPGLEVVVENPLLDALQLGVRAVARILESAGFPQLCEPLLSAVGGRGGR